MGSCRSQRPDRFDLRYANLSNQVAPIILLKLLQTSVDLGSIHLSSYCTLTGSTIAQLRDLESNYNEKVLEIAINTLEKAKRDEFDEDIPEDVRMLFVDKDTVINAVSGSHDMHLLKIDNREDSIVTRANKWCANVVTQVHREEKTRNRNRVSEIHQYTNHLRDNAAKYELRHAA
ncbi:DRC3 protein, partial [Polypterus senegalus]